MKTNVLPLFAALVALLSSSASWAALPENSQVVQAESMTLVGEGWTVREHSAANWYASRPVGQMLGGQNKHAGTAAATFEIPASGKYRIWVRYLDMVNHRSKSGFLLTGMQQGQPVVKKDFDNTEASPRSTPEGQKKWGDGFARWIWDFVEFDAAAGELQVAVEKIHLAPVHGCTRTLDLLLLCDDLTYEPAVTDLTPLYIKVRMMPEQKEPVVIHFWGRRPFSPWYTPHANINRQGIFSGVSTGSADKPGIRMAAGQESAWVDVAPYLAYGGLNRISLYAMRSYHEPESEAHFEIWFSKTPSEAGLIQRAERRGTGDGYIFAVDLVDDRLITETEGSSASLEMAQAAPAVPGRLPSEFPFFTGMSLSEQRSTAEAVAREREALRRIGIGSDKKRASSFFFHRTKSPGCLSQPDRKRIDESIKELAAKNPDRTGWTMINLMDEPGFGFDHVAACPACQQGFTPYLKRLGLADSQIAKLKIRNDPAGTDVDEKASYYYTRRYMNHIMTEMLRAGTQSVQAHLPGIPTTANFACELLEGNLVSRCVDWYEIYGSGALTFGWNEDWGGWARTRQVNGFYVDVMRSACRQPGLDFGIYNVLGRPSWEIQARGFLEIGHGVKAISFFNYGPYYAITSDTNSHRPEVYEAIKRITFPTGAVETQVLAGQPAPADAAQLLSVTGDIWYATRDNVFGKERAWLNLLLRHCNVRCDVLSEDDLATRLPDHRMLFVTDANLRRSAVPSLVKWVHDGGVLYLGAGALARDEFDRPLGLDEALKLQREPLDLQADPGRSEYEMRRLRELGACEGIKMFCGTQKPHWKTLPAGKGKVIVVGFFPAISYIATSERPEGAEHSTLDFDVAHRNWMQKVLAAGGIRPRVRTDNYRVEANWIQSPEADLIALSNWTGHEQTIAVELDGAPACREIASVTGKIASQETKDNTLRIRLTLAAGDLIQLNH
ncbi:MAG: hypothetical protein GX575_04990 [Candidatus Anammoximicrobium sp.]|nr:hypothetical protein [Candidatus Anammoximicrobium sp.]